LNEDYPSALPAVERFIRMYPRHPDVDYAYYMKGLIHFSEAMGFFNRYLPMEREDRDPTPAKKALSAFTLLTQQYPNSQYANDAKQRIIYLRNLVAQNELVAANFYLRKGAYLAAANRASFVVTNFDGSPSLAEALSIMVKAYRALELNDLANDAYRVLALNYPDSRFTQEVT
jgi:outer membrane protein assembly factor BamD